jgi:hypothetical protein
MQPISIILIILKYCGALGAALYGVYATMTEFKEERKVGDHSVKVLSKRGYIGIAFLGIVSLLNLGATSLKDYKDKKKDGEARSAETNRRFDRLYHPLGAITLVPMFALSMDGNADLKAYGERLFSWADSVPNDYQGQRAPDTPLPPPKSIPRDAMIASIKVDFVFSRKDIPLDELAEGDMSFSVILDPTKNSNCISKNALTGFTLAGRCFSVGSDDQLNDQLHFTVSPIRNTPDDRYSNGEIISTTDLLGSKLQIRVCPYVSNEIKNNYSLKNLKIVFPGQQILTLEEDFKRTVGSLCSIHSYTFPAKAEDLEKLFQTNHDAID